MSAMHSVREMVLNNLFAGKAKEITVEWFIMYSHDGGIASLVHVCKHRFWVNSLRGDYTDQSGALAKNFDSFVNLTYFLGAREEKCKCEKPVPKMVRNTYRLATMGIRDG